MGSYEFGLIEMRTDAYQTEVIVRWPFDRETDEWITVTVHFAKDVVSAADFSNEEILELADGSDRVAAGSNC